MIGKHCKYLCCEDLSLVEGYAEAIADSKTWQCHHRKALELGMSQRELKDAGMYYHVPAKDLIFMSQSQHSKMHAPFNKAFKGGHHTDEAKRKIGEASKKRASRIDENLWKQRSEIVALHEAGLSERKIAAKFHCSRTPIHHILYPEECKVFKANPELLNYLLSF